MEPVQAQDNSDTKALFVSPSETYARDFRRIFEPLQTVGFLFQEPTTDTNPSPQEIVVAVPSLPVNGVGGEDMSGNLDAQLPAPIQEQGIDWLCIIFIYVLCMFRIVLYQIIMSVIPNTFTPVVCQWNSIVNNHGCYNHSNNV